MKEKNTILVVLLIICFLVIAVMGCFICKLNREKKNEITKSDWWIPATGHHTISYFAKEPTCTEEGNSAYCYCDFCDKFFSEDRSIEIEKGSWILSAAGHNMTAHVAVGATCTEPGNTAYWSCSRCGKYFSDAQGTTQIAANSWVTAALGHNLSAHQAHSATCTEPGNTAYWSCNTCGKYFSDAGGTAETNGIATK